jgi:hypothetical protein
MQTKDRILVWKFLENEEKKRCTFSKYGIEWSNSVEKIPGFLLGIRINPALFFTGSQNLRRIA